MSTIERASSAVHGAERFDAVYRVRGILLDAARGEVWRRSLSLPQLEANACEEIASASADAALIEVLARLGEVVEGERFTAWVSRFAIDEAAIRMRRLARQPEGRQEAGGERAYPGPPVRLQRLGEAEAQAPEPVPALNGAPRQAVLAA